MKKTTQGFTLLEVMIALVIITIVFMAGFFTLTQTTQNTINIKEKTLGVLVANKEIVLLRVGSASDNSTRKQHDMGQEVFYSSVQTKRTSEPQIIELEVSIEDSQGATILTQTGYRYVEPKV